MTERLFLNDPHLTRFSARVVALQQVGQAPGAVLDRTAFYAEGGGQPGDQGTLGTAKVLDVQDVEGTLVHLLDKPLEVGTELEGQVDWARRLDHMQQHHGQHLLSAAFVRVHRAPTVSFHMGLEASTIDLEVDFARIGPDALRSAEAEANRAVWSDLPVVARDFVGEERAKLSLRKEAVKGDRVVVVEGYDASPCGGTHPSRTGEVGAIAVLGAKRWGNGKTRVDFICGGRVVKHLNQLQATVAEAAESMRCSEAEVAEAALRLAGDLASRRKAADALLEQLADARASQLSGAAPAGDPIVARVEMGSAGARVLALKLVALGRIALIASLEEGRAQLCFARPKGAGASMNELLKEALGVMGGKGGGSPDLAQGSGDATRVEVALEQVRARARG